MKTKLQTDRSQAESAADEQHSNLWRLNAARLSAVVLLINFLSGGIVMKGFILGLGVGLAVGILYAPQEGRKSRANLSDRTSDLLNRADEMLDQTKKAAKGVA
jgi:hypothetical protein